MGNDASKGSKSLFVTAMANVTNIEKRELVRRPSVAKVSARKEESAAPARQVRMRAKFSEAAAKEGNPNTITRDDFTRAVSEIGVNETDSEILDRLFTMFDKMGDGQINWREFVVGVSPLAQGDVSLVLPPRAPPDRTYRERRPQVAQKLETAFELYDVDETGRVKPAEMSFVLNAMNNVASWFGDPAM